ncbi:hypothetical protein DEI93_07170 [Curtobacterium sp. MCBD17_035]|uniref:hypothetical protein n=1 Tax=Curtobacterium sp. MCBD17_035 TaxID=2175673 RepID=UPI000DA85725|nr:hypothetical protein [Curtobacterium sp. MCBD17_035]WIB68802.1 hypothetical protein DEI93_07170 [Curtobacterium sp. MCBD17_035]
MVATPLRISVYESEELQAVLTAMRNLDKTTKKWIRQETRTQSLPIWQDEVRGHVTTALETRVLSDTARVQPSDQNVQLRSASSVARMRGGGTPAALAHATEFGANRAEERTYERRTRSGRMATVRRHTQRQFKPVNRGGYVVYPAAAQAIPRLASLWAQTVARAAHDAMEGHEDG